MKTYQDLVAYLESFIPQEGYLYPREKGLARMKELLHLLGDPHLTYPTVHVVGTAGKSSTAAVLAHVLTTAGYKTGLHISPHLQVIQERMQVDGNMTSTQTLIDLIESEIKPTVEMMQKGKYGQPSYYELFWALTFLHFQKQKVDIAVVEAGLGGTWDGTNALEPIIGILTNVGLDHTRVLGETVEDIAQDKVGVVRSGITIVSGVKQESVKKILRSKIKAQKAKLRLLGRDFDYQIKELTETGTTFHFNNIYHSELKDLHLSLVGKHQVENASLALSAFYEALPYLPKKKINLDKTIHQALSSVRFPGRFETVQNNPRVILEGAHNPDKMKALVAALPLYTAKRVIGLISFKKGKSIEDMLWILLPHLDALVVTEFSVTIYEGRKWSVPGEEIINLVSHLQKKMKLAPIPVFGEKNAQKAVKQALKIASHEDLILITGSLYLVGEVRKIWYPIKV